MKNNVETFRALPLREQHVRFEALTLEEKNALAYDWNFWARESQIIPTGDWVTWLAKAGRGWGKTRVGGETVRIWHRNFPFVNLIGATADDARDIMIEGESGILAICPPHERPAYVASKRRLDWPNGCKSLIFTADEPDRLRGKQHSKVWADEVAAWRYRESWDQMMMGLRLGACPQCVATTTPRPTALIKEIMSNPNTIVTHGTTYENRPNLAAAFLDQIIKRYEGTRLGRQEIHADVLDDNPNALWKRDDIDRARVLHRPLELTRIVVAVDPAVTSNEDSDETGIVVAGVDDRDPEHFYVLDDLSMLATPDAWGACVAKAYADHMADRVVAEVNNGGDLVEALIRTKDRNISYSSVHASRGKAIRAEPVAALYEQGRVHHVGTFPRLEDQLCEFDPLVQDVKSPDRMDALVWAITDLMAPMPGSGFLKWLDSERDAREKERV